MKVQVDITVDNKDEALEATDILYDKILAGDELSGDIFVGGRVVGRFEILEEQTA